MPHLKKGGGGREGEAQQRLPQTYERKKKRERRSVVRLHISGRDAER